MIALAPLELGALEQKVNRTRDMSLLAYYNQYILELFQELQANPLILDTGSVVFAIIALY